MPIFKGLKKVSTIDKGKFITSMPKIHFPKKNKDKDML